MRPNYRPNTQWIFRNRSQSSNRNENYNNDYKEVGVEIDLIIDPFNREK